MSDRPARAVKLNVLNEPKESYTGGPSSLCPGCGHDQISNVIITAAWENGIEPPSNRKDVGHRMLFENPCVLPRAVAWIQHRSRSNALGHHRCLCHQQRTPLPWCVRRRRLSVHRHRATHSRHSSKHGHGVHC